MADKSTTDIANDMIAEFGSEATAMIDARVLECIRNGDRIGAAFWAKLAGTVRAMRCESLRGRRLAAD